MKVQPKHIACIVKHSKAILAILRFNFPEQLIANYVSLLFCSLFLLAKKT